MQLVATLNALQHFVPKITSFLSTFVHLAPLELPMKQVIVLPGAPPHVTRRSAKRTFECLPMSVFHAILALKSQRVVMLRALTPNVQSSQQLRQLRQLPPPSPPPPPLLRQPRPLNFLHVAQTIFSVVTANAFLSPGSVILIDTRSVIATMAATSGIIQTTRNV